MLNSNRYMWQWKKEAMSCKIHIFNFKSHFWRDFLAYCTRPVGVHLAMACVGRSFDSFSIFLFSLKIKKSQMLKKIMFSCIHLPIWPYIYIISTQNDEKNCIVICIPVNCMWTIAKSWILVSNAIISIKLSWANDFMHNIMVKFIHSLSHYLVLLRLALTLLLTSLYSLIQSFTELLNCIYHNSYEENA